MEPPTPGPAPCPRLGHPRVPHLRPGAGQRPSCAAGLEVPTDHGQAIAGRSEPRGLLPPSPAPTALASPLQTTRTARGFPPAQQRVLPPPRTRRLRRCFSGLHLRTPPPTAREGLGGTDTSTGRAVTPRAFAELGTPSGHRLAVPRAAGLEGEGLGRGGGGQEAPGRRLQEPDRDHKRRGRGQSHFVRAPWSWP